MIDRGRQRRNKEDLDDRYRVVRVPVDEINPSPENDDLYGEIEHDEQMDALIDSIEKRGLEEPLILTADNRILSGHRRYYAVSYLDWETVPCRYRENIRWDNTTDYHTLLAEYNPQRIKSVGSLLKEALLRDQNPEDTYDAIREHREAAVVVDVDFMAVDREKSVRAISDKKKPFLAAVQHVVEKLQPHWPLSIRQIHYNLLNKPPLISTPKRSSKDAEHYRYCNDKSSYTALVELLKSARYGGHIPMSCIDDRTRPQLVHRGFESVSQYVQQEVRGFLTGYHRDRQLDQPRHLEIFAEKNTVYGLLERTAKDYYVPLSAGRGFCSTPVWRDMAKRFRESAKAAMTLIIISDYDPEGLELVDDAVRKLRDLWNVPIDGHRVAVTQDQIDELQLAEDFNPAKESSSRFRAFVERTGGEKTWELEALPPDYLIEQVKAAIESNMNMDIFRQVVEQEREDAGKLWHIKQRIAGAMQF